MFGLFQRSHATRVGPRGRVFLQVESLAQRDQPDGTPSIVNFDSQALGGGLYQITGTVIDANPGGLVVSLGGDSSVIGQTATTNSDGTFGLTVQLQAGDIDAGVITATTFDSQGLQSQPVSVDVPPSIVNFNAQGLGNGMYQITGTVIDAHPGGLVVTLGGDSSVIGQTATTNSSGTFSLIVQIEPGDADPGLITASTVDAQGLESQPVQVSVTAPPVIVDFTAEEVGNGLFLITGTVTDANPDGLTITVGGNTTACGTTTTTNEDGSFCMLVQLPVNGTGSGFITATTVDAQGMQSERVQAFVTPTVP
jgi:hypothetical protein